MIVSSPLYALWLSFIISAIAAKPVLKMLIALKSRQTIDPYAP